MPGPGRVAEAVVCCELMSWPGAHCDSSGQLVRAPGVRSCPNKVRGGAANSTLRASDNGEGSLSSLLFGRRLFVSKWISFSCCSGAL